MSSTVETTKVSGFIGKVLPEGSRGYWLNVPLSKGAQQEIAALQAAVRGDMREDVRAALWEQPRDGAHITLVNVLDPLAADSSRNDAMFETARPVFNALLEGVARTVAPVEVHFDTVQVNRDSIIVRASVVPSAVQEVRRQFIEGSRGRMPDGFREPRLQDIVHTTIARFTTEVDLQNVRDAVASHGVNFVERVEEVRMVRVETMPLFRSTVMGSYNLMQR